MSKPGETEYSKGSLNRLTSLEKFRDNHDSINWHKKILCPDCHNEIDPECCHCGSPMDSHNVMWDGHAGVPMGCVCGYADPEYRRQNSHKDCNCSAYITAGYEPHQRHPDLCKVCMFGWRVGNVCDHCNSEFPAFQPSGCALENLNKNETKERKP